VIGRVGRSVRGVGATPVLLMATALLLTGCGVPVPPEVPDTSTSGDAGAGGTSAVDRLVPRDELTGPLTEQLELIAGRVAEIRALLDSAGEDTPGGVAIGPAATEAVGLLLGTVGGGSRPGLLPAIAPDRADAGSDDLITALIALAGETGGERGRLVLELVRDPMLGDLGAWQRDPVGIVTLLRSIADTAASQAGLDAALLEIPGELTRALGYILVIAATEDPGLAAHATRQASGRLGVVLVSIELAVETLVRGLADGTDGPRESGS